MIPQGKWSGAGPIPVIGEVVTCDDRKLTRVIVTGYSVEAGWLMVWGYRESEPSISGNLAGAEILWPLKALRYALQAERVAHAALMACGDFGPIHRLCDDYNAACRRSHVAAMAVITNEEI